MLKEKKKGEVGLAPFSPRNDQKGHMRDDYEEKVERSRSERMKVLVNEPAEGK